jgi:hypothetical protein
MDWFGGGQLDRTTPLVSGVLPIRVAHAQGSHSVRSRAWLDANFHAHQSDWFEARVGVRQPSGALLLYDHAGRFSGTFNLDTRELADGKHSLYFETIDTSAEGDNVGALQLAFETRNGSEPDPCEMDFGAECYDRRRVDFPECDFAPGGGSRINSTDFSAWKAACP